MRILIALSVVALIAGCREEAQVATEAQLRPVRVTLVSDNGNIRQRTFSGVSQSTQESRMSFKVAGTVVELPVQVGDKLAAGDLIASLDRSSFDLQVQQAQASLAQADASRRNADSNYSRVQGLYANSNASRNDLDSARANAESARAQVRASRKALEIAELNRSYTRLTAARDCTIAALDVDLNENVSVGSQVAKVNCGSGIEISIGVPESLISGITQGMPANVRFNVLPGREFTGTVTEVGVASGASAATFPIIVSLIEFDSEVRPSMAAEVRFDFASTLEAGVHVVPAAAVINDERGTFVYVAEPAADNTAVVRRRPVEAGELTANGIEIVTGLNAGDRVVTAGTSVIREQQTVLLPQSAR